MKKTTIQHKLHYQPLYTLIEVCRYARVNPSTLRYWSHRGDNSIVFMPDNLSHIAPFSFINLIETYVLEALRRTYHLPMQRIRRGVDWLQKTYKVEHPLAELNLETDGYNLFIREMGIPINASQRGQSGFPEVLARYLQRIERDKGKIPIRFYPYTYAKAPKIIVMDPDVEYGRPVIEGTRITSKMIFDRYSGGESLNEIAHDYDLDISHVEEALRCESMRLAA